MREVNTVVNNAHPDTCPIIALLMQEIKAGCLQVASTREGIRNRNGRYERKQKQKG